MNTYVEVLNASVVFQCTEVWEAILGDIDGWVIVRALAPTQQIRKASGDDLDVLHYLLNDNYRKMLDRGATTKC